MSFSRSLSWLALAGAGIFASVSAQELDGNFYDGTWTARLQCRTGKGTCAARLSIADFAGTWQDLSGTSAARRSTRSQLAFTVFGDSVSQACPTLGIVVKPIDAKTLAGSVAIGTHATENAEVHASHSAVSAPDGGAGAAEAANSIRLERR